MADKKKKNVVYVQINASDDNFVSKLIGPKKEHDFSDVKLLRNLLSNEKARILHTLKHDEVCSMYDLAKKIGRDVKSVKRDLRLLERFGFIDFYEELKGKRRMLKPVLIIDELEITITV